MCVGLTTKKKWLNYRKVPDHSWDTNNPKFSTFRVSMIWGFVGEITPQIIKKQYLGKITVWGYSTTLVKVSPVGMLYSL